MKFLWSKFLGGFNVFSGAIFGKILHQVIIWAICASIAVGIWYKVFKQRTEVQHQTAESITNVETKSDGFNLIKIKILGFGN